MKRSVIVVIKFDPDRYFIIVCPFYNDEALGCNNFRWIDLEGTQWQKIS